MAISTLQPSVLNENAKKGNPDHDLLSSDGVEKKKKRPMWVRKWVRRDKFYASWILFVHLLCLFAPFTFSWERLGVALLLYVLTINFGITLSYHRNLAHKSFKLPKSLEYLFAYFGMLAYQGDPIVWVSTHRYHHKVTDTERDPHSPTESFMFAHIFWLFDRNKMVQKGWSYSNVEDLMKQPYYRFLHTSISLHAYLLGGLLYLLGGFPYVVWGMGVRTTWAYHITFLVNSACHTWGSQPWNTGDLSRNNWFVAIVTFGEGWHNNHHAFEYSARNGIQWWEIDMTYYVIKTLEFLGLATDVKVPSEAQKHKMFCKNRVGYIEC